MNNNDESNKVNKNYLEAFSKIESLVKINNHVIVAIDGNSGSGKTTLASALSDKFDCNIFHMDDFFLRPELKTPDRLQEIGGNVDYERFYREVICGINEDVDFEYQMYDCKLMKLTEFVHVIPKKLSIVEGVYSMHPTLIDNYHMKIFMAIDSEEQKRRIYERNGPFMYDKFIKEWIPKEKRYFDQMNIREKCDLIIDNNDF
jgi:uridine kinase